MSAAVQPLPRHDDEHSELEQTLIDALATPVVERVEWAPRPEIVADVPPPYAQNHALGSYLAGLRTDGKLWAHQSKALDLIAQGKNVGVTTSTGSGKSLVFQASVMLEILEGTGTAMVFYPQRALVSDQLKRWRAMATKLGVAESAVVEITGDVPVANRTDLLAGARVVLATPDVAHTWLLREQRATVIATFLKRLRYVVIDEAHAFDGVFGTNCGYFFRRLSIAAKHAGPKSEAIQFIAASATIANPADHLRQLTGRQFSLVGEADDGSPQRAMSILHVDGPDHGGAAEGMLAEAAGRLSIALAQGSFIAFVDGRQAVERITKKIGSDSILPYRSGYEAGDRHAIETAIAAGKLKGCCATSALELGVDFATFRAGINLGRPATRKSLLQRVGRVGRAGAGTFAIVAPRHAFTKLGITFAEFAAGAAESCHLQLSNKVIQFQQACCLHHETGLTRLRRSDWPTGFAEIYASVAQGRVPSDPGFGSAFIPDGPHFTFPLRQVGDPQLSIEQIGNMREKLGTITLSKALREAYPGSTYLHFRNSYQVVEWRVSGPQPTILVRPAPGAARTTPLISAKVSIGSNPTSVLDGHCLQSDRGSLAEQWITSTETVFGYSVGGSDRLYADLCKSNRHMRSRHRQFETSGIVLRISEPWFQGDAPSKVEMRKRVANALRTVVLAELGILPSEIDCTHTGIGIATSNGGKSLDDTIVVFDNMEGGLRLTEPLFSRFTRFMTLLVRGSRLAGDEQLIDDHTASRIADWFGSLGEPRPAVGEGDRFRIFAPGSELSTCVHGDMLIRKITGHTNLCLGDSEFLMYSYDLPGGGTGWARHDTVKPFGTNWAYLDHPARAERGEP